MDDNGGMGKPLAVITGASSGIGKVFARRLAASHDLLLIARRKDRLAALAAELSDEHGNQIEVMAADLSVEAEFAAVAERLAQEPELEMLVNNAGFGSRGPFWQVSLALQEQMHRLHVMATLALTHAALRNMTAKEQITGKAGSIINVCSVASFVRRAGSASYGATKSWMLVFTESVYVDLKAAGSAVKMQALCPGFTLSEFHDVLHQDRSKVIGKSMWLSVDRVVDDSLRGLARGKLVVIPDWRYRLAAIFFAKAPQWIRLRGDVATLKE